MSKKTLEISGKPKLDLWVKNQDMDKEPMKRLTFDIPARLHRKIKSDCAIKGVKMVDEIRDILNERYGENE